MSIRERTTHGGAEDRRAGTEDSFRLLVESVKDYAIFLLDPTGRVTTWNTGAERLKGYRAGEIIGRHFSAFYTDEDKADGKPERMLRRALEDGRIEHEGWRVRKDGTLFWADVVITAVYDHEGRHQGFAKITRDLTERRQMEDERLKLAQAEEAIRLREEFISIAAHELRTPLNALQLQLAGLQMLLEPDRQRDTSLEAIAQKIKRSLRQTERLGVLISRLLDVSRLTSGVLSLEKRPMDLVECARDTIAALDTGSERHAPIQLSAPQSATGRWDPLRIEQVITNLLDNAIAYGEQMPIDVSIELNGRAVVLNVADRGPGIAVEDRNRVFDRFTRGRPISRSHGLGLGLYITRAIVEAHGGEIELKDSPAGAHFQVRLPRDQGSTGP